MARPVKKVRFKTKLTRSTADSGWHSLDISREIADKFAFDGRSRRVVCTINGGDPFQCALQPLRDGFYIIVNKEKRDALGISDSDEVNVELVKDESKYGLPMPAEFREVMDQDPEGDRLFHALTAGKQRSMLYHFSKIKDIDRRIHAALIFIEHLKRNDGKIDGKELYEELKRPIDF